MTMIIFTTLKVLSNFSGFPHASRTISFTITKLYFSLYFGFHKIKILGQSSNAAKRSYSELSNLFMNSSIVRQCTAFRLFFWQYADIKFGYSFHWQVSAFSYMKLRLLLFWLKRTRKDHVRRRRQFIFLTIK